MNEELKKLRQSVQLLQANAESQRENAQAMSEIVTQMGNDLDAFIDVYTRDFASLDERITALEKKR